jgi:LysR family transcriptional regulator, carnitine catabolism transcriptional activator
MDIRRLQLFLAVADHGGFTRAANALFISQPALSQGVKELEAEVGVELFHRLGRRVSLTAAGEALLGPARQALRDIEAGKAAVASVSGLQTGRLDLCSLPSLAADPVGPLVGAFRRAHPGISVVLASPRNPMDLVRQLKEGVCEIGVTEAFEVPDILVSRPLVSQELVVVLPPGEQATGEFGLRDLDGMPMVSTPLGTSTRHALEAAFLEAGISPTVAVESAQRDAILPMVVAGAGAAFLPRALTTTAAAQGARVVSLDPPVTRQIVMAFRPGSLSPAAGAFLKIATETAPASKG